MEFYLPESRLAAFAHPCCFNSAAAALLGHAGAAQAVELNKPAACGLQCHLIKSCVGTTAHHVTCWGGITGPWGSIWSGTHVIWPLLLSTQGSCTLLALLPVQGSRNLVKATHPTYEQPTWGSVGCVLNATGLLMALLLQHEECGAGLLQTV